MLFKNIECQDFRQEENSRLPKEYLKSIFLRFFLFLVKSNADSFDVLQKVWIVY